MRHRGQTGSAAHYQIRDYLFWFCAIWTIVQMLLILGSFLGWERLTLPTTMPTYNFFLVGVYVVIKEGARWAHRAIGQKRGEWFFYAWWLFALVLHSVSALNRTLELPDGLLTNCWYVSVLYVASTVSKLLHAMRRRGHRRPRNHHALAR